MNLNAHFCAMEKGEAWWKEIPRPWLIAGPCSAETREQTLETAKLIARDFPHAWFRAGLWKPRTRPGSFEGVGKKGLAWLQQVKQETGLPVMTEAGTPAHIESIAAAGMDAVWLGARTVANPFVVEELAQALSTLKIPVFVKNPIHFDAELWIGAIERLRKAGVQQIGAIHRGFDSAASGVYRNVPHWDAVIHLKSVLPDIPVICDVSHISGNRLLIPQVAQQALDLDLNGLMIETHCRPQEALSDAEQQVSPASLKKIIHSLTIRSSASEDVFFKNRLEELRNEIDSLDARLLELLVQRMSVSRKIGKYKDENNVTILQIRRWKKILRNQHEKGDLSGLSQEFIRKLFGAIHDESIRVQNEVMNPAKKVKSRK